MISGLCSASMSLNVRRSTVAKGKFATDNIVKWCPGCGDYAVLKHLQDALDQAGLEPENVALVSGIGCSSRLPHYMNSYGFHSVHGRAPTIVTGLAESRPDLTTIMITGDGDGLSIGLGHLLHLIRRNVNTTVLLLNNKIYGLTKGQNSPTTQEGFKTKMTPNGHHDKGVNLGPLVLDMGGTFFGRCYDTQGQLLKRLITKGINHPGTAVIEVFQSCPIFNKSAFPIAQKKVAQNPNLVQVWPEEDIHYYDQGLVFENGSWSPGEVKAYNPNLNAAWSLLRDSSKVALGLIWHDGEEHTLLPAKDKSTKPVSKTLWQDTVAKLRGSNLPIKMKV